MSALRIVRGKATADEVAAVVVALASRRAAASEPQVRRSEWARPQPRVVLPPPRPGAWQAATRP